MFLHSRYHSTECSIGSREYVVLDFRRVIAEGLPPHPLAHAKRQWSRLRGVGIGGVGFGVWGVGCGVWGSGGLVDGVSGMGFGIWGLGVWGRGLGVWGLGTGVRLRWRSRAAPRKLKILVQGIRDTDVGSRVNGGGWRVWDVGCRVKGVVCGVWGVGCGV